MLRKIEIVSSILQDWKSNPTRPKQTYQYNTRFNKKSDTPLTRSEVARYKEFLLHHAPITYRELFPKERKGIRIPGMKYYGWSPNDCVGAAWHAVRAEQFLNIYLDQVGIEDPKREEYREVFISFHDLAADATARKRRHPEYKTIRLQIN